jgi:hypothetical protein
MVPSPRLKRSLLAVAVLTGVVLGAVWVLWPEPAIGPASYERIQLAMTQAEVEAVIGLPPGNYYRYPGGIPWNWKRGPFGFTREEKGLSLRHRSEQIPFEHWWGNEYAIQVAFDPDGHAIGCALLDVEPVGSSPSLLYSIRTRLRW